MSLRLDADFTEDVVSIAIESYLTLLSFPRLRFSIEPFSRSKERWLGADARLDGRRIRGFRPFYMQFKRPSAYPDTSQARIVSDRKALQLSVSPRSMFFQLRKKQPAHAHYQHNILLRLRQRLRSNGLGDAAYICPLFLDRSSYRFHMHLAGLRRWAQFWRYDPWEFEEVLLTQPGRTVAFSRVPVLAEHISIPPHDEVTSEKHSYSFDEDGTDLCFHSPKSLPEHAINLATFLTNVADDFLGGGRKVTPDSAFEQLLTLMGSDADGLRLPVAELSRENPIGSWLFWGDMLRREYRIEQYAFVNWSDEL